MSVETVPMKRDPDQKFCHACGRALHISARNCPSCGAEQSQLPQLVPTVAQAPAGVLAALGPQKHCEACGSVIHAAAAACPRCGAPQLSAVNGVNQKNKTNAVVFALLLGGLGVHKFYLGRPVMGIVYLVFFWTFIPAVIALIEGIWYATMNETTFQERVQMGRL